MLAAIAMIAAQVIAGSATSTAMITAGHVLGDQVSAAWTFPAVRGLGNSRELSRPISAMACTTAGFSSLAGCEPAEVTRTRPAACWFSSTAAI